MSNIYEILRPKKGYAYTDEQIVDYSLISIPIPTNKKIKEILEYMVILKRLTLRI